MSDARSGCLPAHACAGVSTPKPVPRPCTASQSSRCSSLTFVIHVNLAVGPWSSSGTGFTTVDAYVCVSLAGQRHQPTHRGGGGGHPAAAPKQGGKRGCREHTWRHADCSQEQHRLCMHLLMCHALCYADHAAQQLYFCHTAIKWQRHS